MTTSSLRARRRALASLLGAGLVLVAAVVVGAVRGETLDAAPPPAPTSGVEASAAPASSASPGSSASSAAGPALRLLAALPVKGRAPATGYDREGDFGTAWLDVDRNGCDTRDDILARDLTGILRQGPCRVVSGTLVSPYTGQTIRFTRGVSTSQLVQIDHVVALEEAWRTGAQQLSQAEREALANDPANLFAVDGHSNQQKGSGDAATWLPARKAFRCDYVEHQVEVKARYRLWVTPPERDAMLRVLSSCAPTG